MKTISKVLFPLLILSISGCTTSNDVSSYKKLHDKLVAEVDFHTGLFVFPEDANNGTPKDFYYKTVPDLFTGSFVFYLVMEYDEENFASEIDRLSKIKQHFYIDDPNVELIDATKTIIHDEANNAFVTIDRDNRYEYALYNENNREIAYISNQLEPWNHTKINSKHIIKNFNIPEDIDDGNHSYNMYYYYTIDKNGLEVGFYCDE